MRHTKHLAIIILALLSLANCTKEEKQSKYLHQEISFSVGSSQQTKTHYDSNNPYQIVWDKDDKITIFCDQAEIRKRQANYIVTPIQNDSTKGTIAKNKEENGLGIQWGKNENHTFYGIYPAVESSNGNIVRNGSRFTLKFPKSQTNLCKKVNGKDVLYPDMNLAYLIATKTTKPQSEPIDLEFNPVSTTLEVTVKGKDTEDERYGDNADLTDLVIKNIEVTIPSQFTKIINGETVIYNAQTNTIEGTPGNGTAEYTVNVTIAGDKNSVILKQNESITFIVFLPPIENINEILIKFNTASGAANNKVTYSTSKVLKPSSKNKFTLPNASKYPFSKFLQEVLIANSNSNGSNNIKVVKIGDNEIIDLTDEATKTYIEKISTLDLWATAKKEEFTSKGLYLSKAKDLKGIDLLQALTTINCVKPRLTGETQNTTIKSIDVSDIKFNSNASIIVQNCDNLEDFNANNNTMLKIINVANNKSLGSIVVSGCTNLEKLYAYSCNLKNINVTTNTNLKELNIGSNKSLTNLDISKNLALTTLYCNSCSLSSINVDSNTNLDVLNIGSNKSLTNLDISKNLALTTLYCNSCSLSSINVTKNTELKLINCSGNNTLENIDITKNTKLLELICSQCNLKNLDVSNNKLLKKLWCQVNRLLTSITGLDQLTNLSEFLCYICKLNTLDVGKNTKLTKSTSDNNGFIFAPQEGLVVGEIISITISKGLEEIGKAAITKTYKEGGYFEVTVDESNSNTSVIKFKCIKTN